MIFCLSVMSFNASAAAYQFDDFSDLSDFQLNGSTATIANPTSDNALRLTNSLSQGGSAFYTDKISLDNNASFSAAFDFRISNPIGISDADGQGADGIVFVVQTVSNTAGGFGGGIGYSGLRNSVGIEFDTWNNGSRDDNNGNHVGIDIGGNTDSVVQSSVGTRMNNGDVWSAWVDYNGLTNLLEVRLSDTGIRSTDPFLSLTTDLAAELGTFDAFIGFTSGTGGAGGYHDILNFTFIDDFEPIQPMTVPEPDSIVLLLLGLFALSFNQYFKRRS
ncbi:MAG: L-type lectin-domain containing protein [Gammaproteobacteria bacterium]